MTPADLRALPPTRHELATICRALTLGGTARGAGDQITIDGYGAVLHISRAAYEAALSTLAAKKDSSA